jgi:hypothetical protein
MHTISPYTQRTYAYLQSTTPTLTENVLSRVRVHLHMHISLSFGSLSLSVSLVLSSLLSYYSAQNQQPLSEEHEGLPSVPALVRVQSTVHLREASSSDDEVIMFLSHANLDEQEVAVARTSTSHSAVSSSSSSSEDEDETRSSRDQSAYTAVYEHSSYAQDDSDAGESAFGLEASQHTVVRRGGRTGSISCSGGSTIDESAPTGPTLQRNLTSVLLDDDGECVGAHMLPECTSEPEESSSSSDDENDW